MTAAIQSTLLDLVQTCSDSGQSLAEIEATVTSLVNSGKVQLCGSFAGEKFALPPSVPALGSPAHPEVSPRQMTLC